MVYRSDIFQPRLLGTESTEHSDWIICGIYKEFTVEYFLIIVRKILSIWKLVIDGGLIF